MPTRDESLAEFQNRVRIMLSIDLHELQGVGLMFNAKPYNMDTWMQWRRFRADPFRYLLTCDDGEAAKIWSVIERRASS